MRSTRSLCSSKTGFVNMFGTLIEKIPYLRINFEVQHGRLRNPLKQGEKGVGYFQ